MNEDTPVACDLCGLPVEVPDFFLMTTEGLKRFCCEGCQGIYEMLHEQDIVPTTDQSRDLQNPGHS